MDDVGVNAEDKNKITPNKVLEMFQTAEDWNDIRQIMVNLNYFVSNQWIGWNRENRRIQALPLYDNQERITLNKIRPRVMTLLAKHTKSKVKFNVVAASKEEKDIDAAKAADQFLKYMWNEMEFTTKTRDIFLNMLVKKRCWVKTWFDSKAGDDITPDEKDGKVYEEWSKGEKKEIHTGEIKARVCDPLTIFWDQAATTEDEIRWVIERKAWDVDEIFEEYGVKIAPESSIDYLNSYDLTRVNGDGISSSQTAIKRNMALVYELWYKPCAKYPGGVNVIISGGKELAYNKDSGEIPYSLFGYLPIPGSLFYDAIVTDMIPVQRGINIKRSMIATHAKRLGNSLWLVPLGSGVDEEELSNETGGFVHYNPINNFKPERAMAPDIPSFFDRDLANDAVDMDDMSGSREVSQGSLPAGLDTASGLEIMVEQENEKLTTGAINYEQAMKKVMRRILRLIKKHYTEPRQAKILGANKEIEIFTFNGSDLTGDEDVDMEEGSSLPEMKGAQQDRIMTMWKEGAIVKNGQPDADKFLRLMGMGDSTDLFEQHSLDENKSKMENKFFNDMLADQQSFQVYSQWQQQKQRAEEINMHMQQMAQQQGVDPSKISQKLEPVPPAPKGVPTVREFQDHEVHIYNHNSFRKGSDYDKLPDEMQAMVDAHVKEHEQMMQGGADPQTQAMQQENQLKQQELQLKAQGQQTDAQLQAAKIAAEREKTQATLQQTKESNAQKLISTLALAEQSHQHSKETGAITHGRSLESGQVTHSQQMERDKLAAQNKPKVGGEK